MNAMIGGQYKAGTGDLTFAPMRVDQQGRVVCGAGQSWLTGAVASEAAYAAGDVLGLAGETYLTLNPHMSEGLQELLILDSLSVLDPRDVKANIAFLFFSASPIGASMTAVDNTALAWSVDGRNAYLGKVEIVAADYTTIAGVALATVNNLGLALNSTESDGDGGARIYMVPVIASGTPDWTAGDTLKFAMGIRKG